jgi:ATP-dependent Clp protease ATP-binding subunit ClpC
MATHTIPILLWRDAQGGVTGILLGDVDNTCAWAATEHEVLRQLRDFLDWRARNESYALESDMVDPTLREVKVEVRGEYTLGERKAPVPDVITMRVPCVIGTSPGGMPVCEAPHLGISFFYADDQDLSELLRHYVRETLRAQTPAQLIARLPPAEVWLDSVNVREHVDNHRQPPTEQAEIKLMLEVADPLLRDWARGSAAYCREWLVDDVATKLHTEKANILLVGEAGIGKSTVLLNAVRQIHRTKHNSDDDSNTDNDLRAYRYWRGNAARIIAGMRYLGQWEERCEKVIEILNGLNGVLCLENLLETIRVGGSSPGDSVAAFLLPYLQRGELRVAAEVSPTELEACRRLMPALLDCFQVITIEPFHEYMAHEALDHVVDACASAGRLEFEQGVTSQTLNWFRRFQPYASMPGPAANFVRKLAELARRKPLPTGATRRLVSMDDARELFIRQTGLPERLLRDDIILPPAEIEATLSKSIIGQPTAVHTATRVIAKLKAGLNDPGKPLGVLLLCGPTGVGKTALARALAEFCFGAGTDKDRLVRLDMSEYAGYGAGWRLMHSTDREPAPWITKVRRQPFSVVLFDEIEKASPEVFDVLLGLLDEGRLTDDFGSETNFRSTIVLMTSNLGSSKTNAMGFNEDGPPGGHQAAVEKFFRPEFFNRLDGVVSFQSLTSDHVREIATKELCDLSQREGLKANGITLTWTPALVDTLTAVGHDPRYGARPLQRELERLVVRPLAYHRLAQPDLSDCTLQLDWVDGQTSIQRTS